MQLYLITLKVILLSLHVINFFSRSGSEGSGFFRNVTCIYIKKKKKIGVKCAQILYHKNNCDVLEKISCSGYPCSWSFWMMRSLDGGIPLFIFANPVYMSES